MPTVATTAAEYLASLPEDRRRAIGQVRQVLLENLSPGFEEGIQYGMLAYYVPHALYPRGYHVNPKLPLPFVSLAAQKSHLALYLMGLYEGSDLATWFEAEWKKTGKKLDMGKSCLRFKKVEDLALDVVAALLKRVSVADYVAAYEAALSTPRVRSQPGTSVKVAPKGSKPASKRKPKTPARG